MTQRFRFVRPAALATWLVVAALPALAQTPAPAPDASARERLAVEAAFNRADANGDGKLSRDEASQLPAIALKFDDLDKNKDGFLSMEEFSAILKTPAQ
jgi:Ca2+-binding EF-hand superfamily protein